MPEEYIDTYQAAEELGISRATLWKLLARYEMTSYRLPGNRRTLLKRSDVDKLREPIPLDRTRRGRPRKGGAQGRSHGK